MRLWKRWQRVRLPATVLSTAIQRYITIRPLQAAVHDRRASRQFAIDSPYRSFQSVQTLPAMPKRPRKPARSKTHPTDDRGSLESHASQAITIAWTASVTGVVMADLLVVAAHLYVRYHPDAQPARALEAVMLLSAAAMGAMSLIMLPIVWRVRRVKPPQGYAIFAILVAIAPIMALLGRLMI